MKRLDQEKYDIFRACMDGFAEERVKFEKKLADSQAMLANAAKVTMNHFQLLSISLICWTVCPVRIFCF
jgi:hypothetical protein